MVKRLERTGAFLFLRKYLVVQIPASAVRQPHLNLTCKTTSPQPPIDQQTRFMSFWERAVDTANWAKQKWVARSMLTLAHKPMFLGVCSMSGAFLIGWGNCRCVQYGANLRLPRVFDGVSHWLLDKSMGDGDGVVNCSLGGVHLMHCHRRNCAHICTDSTDHTQL